MFKSKNVFWIMITTLILSFFIGLILQFSYSDGKNQDSQRTTIHFWNAMSGGARAGLDKIISNYNKSQSKYFVVSDYEGAYADTLAKYLSVANTASSPDLVQVYDIGTQVMREQQVYLPIQVMMDKDHYDKSQLEPRIQQYWNVNNQQQSMPFNTSTPVMIYNKDLLASVGVTKAPATYEDITAVGQKLKQAGSKSTAFGIYTYGWFYEQMFANQGQVLINQNNGQTGTPTESLANNQAGINFMSWEQELLQSGNALNYGTKEDVMITGFLQKNVGMIFSSSANSAKIIKTAKFNVGIAYLPHPDSTDRYGVTPGGASVYIAKGRSTQQTEGAWDFLKYASSAPVQAQWALDTGYFPVNHQAYSQPVLSAAYQKYPELKNAASQLQTSQNIAATSGIFSSTDTLARQTYETAMGKIYAGADVKSSLDDATSIITKELLLAKKTQGK